MFWRNFCYWLLPAPVPAPVTHDFPFRVTFFCSLPHSSCSVFLFHTSRTMLAHVALSSYPENRGIRCLSNVGKFLPGCVISFQRTTLFTYFICMLSCVVVCFHVYLPVSLNSVTSICQFSLCLFACWDADISLLKGRWQSVFPINFFFPPPDVYLYLVYNEFHSYWDSNKTLRADN